MSFRYAAQVSYIGSNFCGWQRQLTPFSGELNSIQDAFETTLASIISERVSVIASGRTDAGVHALRQVVHFTLTKREFKEEILLKALNSRLPTSVRVLAVVRVPLDFHAQRSAEKKRYSYYFQLGPAQLPQFLHTAWWVYVPMNVTAMRESLTPLVGEHDFKPFQASGSRVMKSTVREIYEAKLELLPIPFPFGIGEELSDYKLLRFSVTGSGFLKQMVRALAGTLYQVGKNKKPASIFQEILQNQDRNRIGTTAPAHGLWLEKVWYREVDFVLPPNLRLKVQ